MSKCPHCEFIDKTFPAAKEMSPREYWIFTEVFCYLHRDNEYPDECGEGVVIK